MDPDDIAIGIIAGLLEARTGQKLTEDRRWRIAPALAGLFRDRGISSNQDLVVLLTQPDESSLAQEVVEALLNNETYSSATGRSSTSSPARRLQKWPRSARPNGACRSGASAVRPGRKRCRSR